MNLPDLLEKKYLFPRKYVIGDLKMYEGNRRQDAIVASFWSSEDQEFVWITTV